MREPSGKILQRKRLALACRQVDALLAIAVADHRLSAQVAAQGGALQSLPLPAKVDLKSTLRAQAFHSSSGPRGGQRG